MRQESLSSLGGGLRHLPQLESLWVTDCRLSSLEAGTFVNNSRLENLHLSGNKLTTRDVRRALAEVKSLRQLWLNDNMLTSLDGIGRLINLKSLWVCRNKIERVGECLSKLNELTDLNVADNRIGCFKELLPLANVQMLEQLSLSDPHFGSNPVCVLCNYQTYALYHLSQISVLDGEVVR